MTLTTEQRIRLQKHWLNFKKGLLLFIAGAVLVFAGYRWQVLLQIPGLILLTTGVLFAGAGYAGILRFRLQNAFTLTKNKSAKNSSSDS